MKKLRLNNLRVRGPRGKRVDKLISAWRHNIGRGVQQSLCTDPQDYGPSGPSLPGTNYKGAKKKTGKMVVSV